MISLDGVMQAPGAPGEDTSGGFTYGGWVAPFNNQGSGEVMKRLMQPADLLLGRRTFEIWEHYWPQHAEHWPGINEVTKYVFSATRTTANWNGTVFLNSIAQIKKLKDSPCTSIQVWGSSQLIQLLLAHQLADELWLMIHPLTLGQGKKLFADGPIAAAYTLAESSVSPGGVIMANYRRAGQVKTGTVGS